MSEEKPSMSMCVNLEDYHKKVIDWQKERIEQLEESLFDLRCELREAKRESD